MGEKTARRGLALPEEVAEYLRVKPKTLYQWRWLGIGPTSVTVNKGVRYRWEDVEDWLAEQRRVPTPR